MILILGVGGLFHGAPGIGALVERATGREAPWSGLDPWLERTVGPTPLLVVEHSLRDGQLRIDRSTSVSRELALLLGKVVTLAVALAWLRRAGGPRVIPDRADVARTFDVLAWIVPAFVVVVLVLALGGDRLDGGRGARALVDGLVAPPLVHPLVGLSFALRLVVLAPLLEEVVWRGFVYPGLRSRMGPATAGGVGALLFGLAHLSGGWVHPAPLTLQYGFALLAQHLVERRPDSLGAPLLLHMIGNLAALLLHAGATFWPGALLSALGAL